MQLDLAIQHDGIEKVALTQRASSLQTQRQALASSCVNLNNFLEGGLPWGQLIEWGAPWGVGCRDIILSFLKTQTNSEPLWCLWSYQNEKARIYPPAWQARGVDLDYIRFARSTQPMQDLKAAFMASFFRIIVLDGYHKLYHEDYRFLAQQAREQRSIVIVLRNHFLSSKKGNIWAKLRFNSWKDPLDQRFFVQAIKGLSPRQLSFSEKELVHRQTGFLARHRGASEEIVHQYSDEGATKITTQRNQSEDGTVHCQTGFLARHRGVSEEIVNPYSDEGATKITTQRNQSDDGTVHCQTGFLARHRGASEEIVHQYSDEGATKITTQRNQSDDGLVR